MTLFLQNIYANAATISGIRESVFERSSTVSFCVLRSLELCSPGRQMSTNPKATLHFLAFRTKNPIVHFVHVR